MITHLQLCSTNIWRASFREDHENEKKPSEFYQKQAN